MKKQKGKYVKESLDEQWVSNDTGINIYYGNSYPQPREDNSSDITGILPPEGFKFNEESFAEYVNRLIEEVLPQAPSVAITAFKEVIKTHPYLTKKLIGFGNKENPYEKHIRKFIETFKQFAHNR
jgi:hypothetical protein